MIKLLSRGMHHFFFRKWYLILIICFFKCTAPVENLKHDVVTFLVPHVGQGFASIVIANDSALIFDVGPETGFDSLFEYYNSLGAPPVAAVFISHSDGDHCGALSAIGEKIDWSGTLFGTRSDSAVLVEMCSRNVQWSSMSQGDEVHYSGCTIDCLWPPLAISNGVALNSRSLVVRFSYGETSVLIPGDIDTTVTRLLREMYGSGLSSDILVVPHHGSAGSADRLFYGFINPEMAVISSGENNRYGHPHEETLAMLTFCSVPFRITSVEGSMCWRSNGFYWTELF